jgi:hypothetical protein
MTEQELQALAKEYVEQKAILDPLKKRVDSINSNIKLAMQALETDCVELEDGSKVVYSVSTSNDFNEEKLLAVLHKFAPDTQCIKTKEYIDTDILESELYHEKFSNETLEKMDECRVVKEIPKLTIKKAKKEK